MGNNYLVKRTQTKWQGLELFAVYDREFYTTHNPEFQLSGLTDQECLEHFGTIGMRQGKCACKTFDPRAYGYNYPELRRRFGEDYRQYYMHYLEHGMRNGWSGKYDVYQGRCYKRVFELYYYQEINPDIREEFGDDNAEYIKHFVAYGMAEGRMATPYFDVFSYKRRYDLRHQPPLDKLTDYYYKYMDADEGTIDGDCSVYGDIDYSPVYYYPYYRANNPDIRESLGDNAFLYIKHFVEYGMAEGRNGNGKFDVYRFREQHPELKKRLNDHLPLYYIEYIKQYMATGCRGNRDDEK